MATLKELVAQTTTIKNELKNCHTSLVNNLTNVGITCSSSDKMQTLIDKIATIETGTTITEGSYDSTITVSSTSYAYTTITTGTSFTPSRIFVKLGSHIRYSGTSPTNDKLVNLFIDSKTSTGEYVTASATTTGIKTDFYISNITSDSFRLYYKISTTSYTVRLSQITWCAIK